ncbi:MAG: sugar ABC transporter permease [Lachnospiraceae bacterium]|nr:sugar ABC transporter permease [Lachnospiraceae bacterium]
MKKQRSSLKKGENIVGWAFVAPTMLIFFVLTAFPFFFSIFLSMADWKFFNGWDKLKFVGLENFVELFEDEDFWNAMKNTIIYTVTIVPLSIGISIVFAYGMNGRIFGKKVLRMLFFIPYISSMVAVGAVFRMLFREEAVVNNLLLDLNLISEPIKWAINAKLSKVPIILLSVWCSIGYQLILFTAAMQNVPNGLYEAARIDGANGLQQFIKITLPMISPTIFYLVITRTMSVLKIFGSVNVFTMNTSTKSNTSVVVDIYNTAFVKYDFGPASAMSMILFVLVMVVTAINFWGQKKWVHY